MALGVSSPPSMEGGPDISADFSSSAHASYCLFTCRVVNGDRGESEVAIFCMGALQEWLFWGDVIERASDRNTVAALMVLLLSSVELWWEVGDG